MLAKSNENMMQLLSQVIISDGHIYHTEVKALASGAKRLGITDQAGQTLSDKQCLDWFRTYLDDLNQIVPAEPHDVIITKLVLALTDWPDKHAVVQTLEDISISDGEYHKKEKNMLALVKTFWQYEGLEASATV